MPKGNYLRQKLIDHSLRNTAYTSPAAVYVALYTSDPTNADVGTEVSGGAYARVAVTFTAPTTSGATENSGTITFPTATANWGTVTHFAIRDAASGGNLLYYNALTNPRSVLNGDTPKFTAGDLDVSES